VSKARPVNRPADRTTSSCTLPIQLGVARLDSSGSATSFASPYLRWRILLLQIFSNVEVCVSRMDIRICRRTWAGRLAIVYAIGVRVTIGTLSGHSLSRTSWYEFTRMYKTVKSSWRQSTVRYYIRGRIAVTYTPRTTVQALNPPSGNVTAWWNCSSDSGSLSVTIFSETESLPWVVIDYQNLSHKVLRDRR